jgi:hypothetical protein
MRTPPRRAAPPNMETFTKTSHPIFPLTAVISVLAIAHTGGAAAEPDLRCSPKAWRLLPLLLHTLSCFCLDPLLQCAFDNQALKPAS